MRTRDRHWWLAPTARLATATVVFIAGMAVGAVRAASGPTEASQGDPTRTIRDGVYTVEQAARGRKLYEAICIRCHGEDLLGANARPLAGDAFIRDWGGMTLDHFYERAKTMPPGDAARLADDEYLDVVTYVLEVNAVPAGDAELEARMLPDIVVEGEGGPDEVPDFSLVQVVGCLTRGPDGDWLVSDATDPVRTRDPAASAGDALSQVEATAPGSGSFRLMYVFPDPAAYEGHRVETKGFLIRGPQDALNVTVVASLASTCAAP